MHDSGASRREVANAYLEKRIWSWLFEIFETGVCVRSAAFLAPQNASVMPGLDPGIHQSSRKVFRRRWITGSPSAKTRFCPVTTISIGMTLLAITANTTRFHRPHFELDSKADSLRAATGGRRLSVIRIPRTNSACQLSKAGAACRCAFDPAADGSVRAHTNIFIKNNGGNA